MCQALEKDGLPMPEYTVHPGDIMIKFTGPEDRIIRFSGKVTDVGKSKGLSQPSPYGDKEYDDRR